MDFERILMVAGQNWVSYCKHRDCRGENVTKIKMISFIFLKVNSSDVLQVSLFISRYIAMFVKKDWKMVGMTSTATPGRRGFCNIWPNLTGSPHPQRVKCLQNKTILTKPYFGQAFTKMILHCILFRVSYCWVHAIQFSFVFQQLCWQSEFH